MLVFVFICPKHYYWVWDRLSWCLVSRIAGRTLWDVSVQVSNGPPDIRPSSKIDIIITIGIHINLNACIPSRTPILRIDIITEQESSFSFESFMPHWQTLQMIAKADHCHTLSVMTWVLHVVNNCHECSVFAKDCILTGQEQAYSRVTRLFDRLAFTMPKMVVDCPIVITSLGDTLFQTRIDQEWGIIGQASLLHILDIGFCWPQHQHLKVTTWFSGSGRFHPEILLCSIAIKRKKGWKSSKCPLSFLQRSVSSFCLI